MSETIIVTRCVNCGVVYGVTDDFDAERRQDKRPFYCPNGHPMSYHESEADRLRRDRDRLQQQIARVEEERTAAWQAESDAIDARRKVERELKRVNTRLGAGVCPCCNRTFWQLSRHMQSKHPDVPFMPAAKKPDRPERSGAGRG